MGEKKQLNVRIPLELQNRIEKDGRPKVDIVTEALELYFGSKKEEPIIQADLSDEVTEGRIASISPPVENNEVIKLKNEVEFLRTKLDDILKLLHQEQVLHIQTQRMLTAPKPEKKKWWQFWQ